MEVMILTTQNLLRRCDFLYIVIAKIKVVYLCIASFIRCQCRNKVPRMEDIACCAVRVRNIVTGIQTIDCALQFRVSESTRFMQEMTSGTMQGRLS